MAVWSMGPVNLDPLAALWDRIRSSLWFVPGLMAAGAVVLAAVIPQIDQALADEAVRKVPLVFTGTAAGARAVLSTIAGSMITIAGVVFSMTIVSLQLASSQFGPRLLRTFLRDRTNQFVLGTFVATFLFCILVLPSIVATKDDPFVPHVAVTVAVGLALLSLGVLVYYIDHVAQSIHADAVVDAVGEELDETIDRLFPEMVGEAAETAEARLDTPGEPTAVIEAPGIGFLRYVAGSSLLRCAKDRDLKLRVVARPGDYLLEGDPLMLVWSVRPLRDDDRETLTEAFELGRHRTTLQDVRFAFGQLAEMAVRALSPGINDPTTAIHCINRIGAGLARFAQRERPSPVRLDDDGHPRLHARPVTVDDLLDYAIDPIYRDAGSHLHVWIRLLESLTKAHGRASQPSDREVLNRWAGRIHGTAQAVFEDERDRLQLMEALGG